VSSIVGIVPTYEEIKAAEDRLIETSASLQSYLELRRIGKPVDFPRHRELVEKLKAATDEYAQIILKLAS
jgi:hypothetical protein